MKKLKLTEAMRLIAAKTSPAVSIYLKTDIEGRDGHKTIAANLQRLYRTVELTLEQRFSSVGGARLLSGLRQILRTIKPKRSRGGLAIYHSEAFTGFLELPTPVSDLAVTADSFHLKPVIKANQLRRSFYLMAFGNKAADFYKVTADKITKLESSGYHSHRYSPSEGPPPSMYRIRKRDHTGDWIEMLQRQVDLHCSVERLPLLIAGSLYHQNIFRHSCTYPFLVENGMTGDVTRKNEEGLFQISSLFMEGYFSAYQDVAVKSFKQAEVRGETSNRIEVIAKAAAAGNVRHIFIAEDRHIWGRFDRKSGVIRLTAGSERDGNDDILDDLAELTLAQSGEVTVLPSMLMPDGQPIGAIFKKVPEEKSAAKALHYFQGEISMPSPGHAISLTA